MFHIPARSELEIITRKQEERTYQLKEPPPWPCCCVKQTDMPVKVNEMVFILVEMAGHVSSHPTNPAGCTWRRRFLPFLGFFAG